MSTATAPASTPAWEMDVPPVTTLRLVRVPDHEFLLTDSDFTRLLRALHDDLSDNDLTSARILRDAGVPPSYYLSTIRYLREKLVCSIAMDRGRTTCGQPAVIVLERGRALCRAHDLPC